MQVRVTPRFPSPVISDVSLIWGWLLIMQHLRATLKIAYYIIS